MDSNPLPDLEAQMGNDPPTQLNRMNFGCRRKNSRNWRFWKPAVAVAVTIMLLCAVTLNSYSGFARRRLQGDIAKGIQSIDEAQKHQSEAFMADDLPVLQGELQKALSKYNEGLKHLSRGLKKATTEKQRTSIEQIIQLYTNCRETVQFEIKSAASIKEAKRHQFKGELPQAVAEYNRALNHLLCAQKIETRETQKAALHTNIQTYRQCMETLQLQMETVQLQINDDKTVPELQKAGALIIEAQEHENNGKLSIALRKYNEGLDLLRALGKYNISMKRQAYIKNKID